MESMLNLIDNKIFPKPKTEYIYYNKDEDIYWCYQQDKQKMKIRILFNRISI